MNWVWVLSFTVLGSKPEHGQVSKFQTKQECQQALILKKQELESAGKQVVATCYYRQVAEKGWW